MTGDYHYCNHGKLKKVAFGNAGWNADGLHIGPQAFGQVRDVAEGDRSATFSGGNNDYTLYATNKTDLESISFGKGDYFLDNHVFDKCVALEDISVTGDKNSAENERTCFRKIGARCFTQCSSLTSESVQRILDNLFVEGNNWTANYTMGETAEGESTHNKTYWFDHNVSAWADVETWNAPVGGKDGNQQLGRKGHKALEIGNMGYNECDLTQSEIDGQWPNGWGDSDTRFSGTEYLGGATEANPIPEGRTTNDKILYNEAFIDCGGFSTQFQKCEPRLTVLDLPAGLKTIHSGTFANIPLTKITVRSAGWNAFTYWSKDYYTGAFP